MVKKQNPHGEQQLPSRFKVGEMVRVKPGTPNPNFPDIPLGGWCETIEEVEEASPPPMLLIRWNRHTLDNMHPVYRKRCERDGLELEAMWLGDDELELINGEPIAMEQPKNIQTRPLNMNNQDDRIREIFGLSSDDPLPCVDEECLRKYHSYLMQCLRFPFPATFSGERGSFKLMICGLFPDDDFDEMCGIICEVRDGERPADSPLCDIEAKKGDPNRQIVKDYSYWFGNWR